MKKITFSLAVALFVTSAASAEPSNTAEVRSERVATGDLDLASPTGRSVLDSRIRRAAKLVCAEGGGLLGISVERNCYRLTISRAMEQRDKLLNARGISKQASTELSGR